MCRTRQLLQEVHLRKDFPKGIGAVTPDTASHIAKGSTTLGRGEFTVGDQQTRRTMKRVTLASQMNILKKQFFL
ncbi:hypothetical protein JTE90_028793 [Oedothorax gibbosus]|uniref:Uncharacterized protein n=1 Tax=Oedothorax gibbosus TaxID=931172 RepID=A0AAV6VYK7_9ARAC|nr:hypothetical protein JTE90_028793 [Oedothorax gibbosus]